MEQPEIRKATVDDARIGSDVWLARIFLLAVLGVGIAAMISGAPPEAIDLCPCPLYSITHVRCPGCGMTHACIALARGDIRMAWNYHPFSLGLILLALGMAFIPRPLRRGWQRIPHSARSALVWSLLVLVLGFWAHRLPL